MTKSKDLAETVNQKKTRQQKEINPFEVHINKKKRSVIGQKSKNDRGLPGVARDKTYKMQKNTLMVEYKNQNKSNSFVDKRIGQNNRNVSVEDRSLMRFSRESIKRFDETIFDEQTLPEERITHKGQILSEIEKFEDPESDSDDDDQFISKKFVNEVHFGDGISELNSRKRSHKELIEDMITDSKIRKAELRKVKDETSELTKQLDDKWMEILPLIGKSDAKGDLIGFNKEKESDYDKMMGELIFESCGLPSSRLKSEEEVAKDEREKLEELENERLKRMCGLKTVTCTHKSADDLDDDYDSNSDGDGDGDGDEDVEESDGGSEQDDGHEDDKGNDNDNLLELKNESADGDSVEVESTSNKEIPYVIPIPKNYNAFQELIKDHNIEEQALVIRRIIVYNNPKLEQGNKEKLSLLLMYTVKYCLQLANCAGNRFGEALQFLDNNLDNLYDLLHNNVDNSFEFLIETLQEVHDEYVKNGSGEKSYPRPTVIVLCKLIGFYCPTSDFRHQIVTPTLIFISQMLTKCKVLNRYDVSFGLLLCTIVAEYTKQSKRYCPSTINFLTGLMMLSNSKNTTMIAKPFNKSPEKLLVIENQVEIENLKINLNDLFKNEIDDVFKNQTMFLMVNLCDIFLDNLKELPSVMEIFNEFFGQLSAIDLDKYSANVKSFVQSVQLKFNHMKNDKRYLLLREKAKKPKALRLYEPRIEQITERSTRGSKRGHVDDDSLLVRKFKKEKRGAVRKIRKDNAFLSRMKIKERIDNDKMRRDKVNRIFADAAVQQHELKKLEKIKKKFK